MVRKCSFDGITILILYALLAIFLIIPQKRLNFIGDTEKMLGLENCFVYMAREAVFDCMVYI